jgi:uroporphyrinogen-III synthase
MAGQTLPVIITRAEPGTHETAARLLDSGMTPIPAPALYIETNTSEDIPHHSDVSGLVFTSANGVRCYVNRTNYFETPAWCVGPATAKAARDSGFKTVHESAGNAVDLANYIAKHAGPTDKPLLHVANGAAKGELKRELEKFGFAVEFCPLYHMRQSESLPAAAIEALESDLPALVLIHSAKGAEAFAARAKNCATNQVIAVSISKQAANPLTSLDLKAVIVATAPNEDGLFGAINDAIAILSA